MQNAYAPYSNFQVGSAILSANGKTYSGANVENAAYPLGCCAEASAISAMVRDGEQQIAEIVVVGKGDNLVTPCGGCRQKIREFATPETRIHVCDPKGLRKTYRIEQLLPDSFGPENLK
jgi:cytidine deaminase